MGVDIFSAGVDRRVWTGVEMVRYEDPALGIYKKLLLKDNQLPGVILVGEHRRRAPLHGLAAQRNRSHSAAAAALFSAGKMPASKSLDMPDSETVCGCNGRHARATIIDAIHDNGISTLAQLKERTRASTSCGSCTELCQQAAARRRAGFPGRDQDHAVLVRAVLLRTICARYCAARN